MSVNSIQAKKALLHGINHDKSYRTFRDSRRPESSVGFDDNEEQAKKRAKSEVARQQQEDYELRLLNMSNIHAIPAPAPDDIYLENLEYYPTRVFLRFCLTFFVVFLTSLALFGICCIFRYYSREWSQDEDDYLNEQVVYYGTFLLTYVADWCLRPILYWAQGFERHYSYTQRE